MLVIAHVKCPAYTSCGTGRDGQRNRPRILAHEDTEQDIQRPLFMNVTSEPTSHARRALSIALSMDQVYVQLLK